MLYLSAQRSGIFVVVVLCAALLTSASVKAQAVTGVSLDTPQAWHVWPKKSPDGVGRTGAPLAIELTRQAILIAARDELGLRTLDASLGEPVELEGVRSLEVDIECVWAVGSVIRLKQGGEVILETTIESQWEVLNKIDIAVGAHEAFSREVSAHALREAGLVGEPNPWIDSADIPDDIAELVDDVSLISQYRAARRLHWLIREEGESPERLWALSRVYANLAQECRWFLRCQFAVFQARSLLYAKRLAHKASDHPMGDLATAYAWTLAGYPTYAEPYQARLDKLVGDIDVNKANPPEWIAWVKLLHACAKHDRLAIQEIMQDRNAQSAVAALWTVYETEFVHMPGLTFKSIKDALQVNPRSTRLLYGGYDAMGVSTGHWLTQAAPEHFAFMTSEQLKALEHGPKPLLEHLANMKPGAWSMTDLAQTGWVMEDITINGNDPHEFTFAVLGKLIGEANALHTVYRARFMRTQWNVDNADFIRRSLPALDRHPFQPLIHSHVQKRRTSNKLTQKLMSRFEPGYINPYSISLFTKHLPFRGPRFANGWEVDDWWNRVIDGGLYASNDYLYNERWFSRDDYDELAKNADRMQWSDKHHPRRIVSIVLDPRIEHKSLKELAEQYGNHPLVANALAGKMELLGEHSRARDYAELAVQGAPELETLERLARLELLLGEEQRWLDTMKSILTLPDQGLDHANVNQTIAYTFMSQQRFEDALPYSQRAAESGAGWAMSSYMFNLALLGELEQAKRVGHAIDRRYGLNNFNAFNIAVWAGDIDVEVMTRQTERDIKQQYGAKASQQTYQLLYVDMQLGQFDTALKRVMEDLEQASGSPRSLLFGVVAAQYLERDRERDLLLEMLVEFPKQRGKRTRFALLGDMMQEGIRTGRIDWDAADRWTENYDNRSQEVAGNLGLFALRLPKEKQRGLVELLALAKKPEGDNPLVNTARTLLRELGYTDEQMLPTGFDGHAYPQDGLE